MLGEIALGSKVEIAVCDSGIDIAPQHQPDIFTEFYQVANKERDQQQGMGLGLAIVRHSMAMLEGHALDF